MTEGQVENELDSEDSVSNLFLSLSSTWEKQA